MEMILTIMANDRPGITEQLAKTIEDNQGNWLESRLASMSGKFAGIIRIEVPDSQVKTIQSALQGLRDHGLSVQVELGHSETQQYTEHCVEVVGNDRPGIIREVTQALANNSINVIDLHTEIEAASMSGGSLFKAKIEFGLTEGQTKDMVIQALEELSPDLMADIL